MYAADLVALIPGGAKRRGEYWDALCPAHDDTRASFSFHNDNARRRVGLLCRVGCSPAEIAAALGLSLADLYHDNGAAGPARVRAPAPPRRVVAEYAYHDEAGTLLYVVERLDPKGFRQKRPDPRGGWIFNLDGVRRVLFGLPELQGQPHIFLCEGEKDVLSIRALGFIATCNPQGAGQWKDDYAQQLVSAGAQHLVILPDHDTPGAAHSETEARSCAAAGLGITVVALPGLTDKQDVTDWLAAGHTKAELIAAVSAAPNWTDSNGPPGADGAAVLVRLADVAPEPVEWAWPGRIPRGKLTLIIGDPGIGKSYLLLDVMARLSRGAVWPDGGRAPAGDAVLLTAEDGLADTIRPRLDALNADVRRVHALTAVREAGEERAFNLGADLAQLAAAIQNTRALLVGVDPLSAYLGDRDSYKDSEIRGVLGPVAALAERTSAAIVAIIHLTKDQQRQALYRALGSIAFVAAARVVLAVGKDPEDEDRRIVLTIKNNLAAPSPALAFTLKRGVLDWFTEPVTGIDVEAVLGATASQEARQEGRDAENFLRALLAAGDVKARDGEAGARATGIALRTLDRARRRLGARAYSVGFKPKVWWWTLRPKDAEDAPEGRHA